MAVRAHAFPPPATGKGGSTSVAPAAGSGPPAAAPPAPRPNPWILRPEELEQSPSRKDGVAAVCRAVQTCMRTLQRRVSDQPLTPPPPALPAPKTNQSQPQPAADGSSLVDVSDSANISAGSSPTDHGEHPRENQSSDESPWNHNSYDAKDWKLHPMLALLLSYLGMYLKDHPVLPKT